MKILYVITQGEQGGGQKYILDLAIGMLQKGHEVYVAVGDIENEGDKWLFESLEKNGIPKTNLIEIKTLQREIKIFRDIRSVWDTVKVFRKIRPDIIHLNSSKVGLVGSIAGFLTRTKTVYTVHGFVFLEPMNFIKKFIYILFEFISARLRNFTILISQKDIEAGKKFGILSRLFPPLRRGGKGGSYKLIYNGIDSKRGEEIFSKEYSRKYIFEKIAQLPRQNLLDFATPSKEGESQVRIVGTIANLFKTKGLEYFIDAAKLVGGNNIFVVLGFGDENYKQELQMRINKNNLQNNFFLLGKVPDAFKYLKGLDLFVLSSVKEGLPYSLLEANMAGVTIVATRVGGIPEMATQLPITLIDSQNSPKLAGEIQSQLLLTMPQHTNSISQFTFPEVFKLENMINETFGVYEKMLK